MSGVQEAHSLAEFRELLNFGGFVVAEFYTARSANLFKPILAQIAAQASLAKSHKFVKVDADSHKDIASAYDVKTIPAFALIQKGKVSRVIPVGDVRSLGALLKEIMEAINGGQGGAGEASGSGSKSASGGLNWLGADLPRGYRDVSDQVEHKRVELLNIDSEKGAARVLFNLEAPSSLPGGKGKNKEVDWVESDTDEQLLLFMPFQSVLKLHTLQITSLPPSDDEDLDEDEIPMRPKEIKLYTNRPHNLGFDGAESTQATQELEISESDWNADGTANIPLRFVKFQNVNSLIIFVVSGEGSSEKVRIDRLRLIGETGEKREMGKLEKVGEDS